MVPAGTTHDRQVPLPRREQSRRGFDRSGVAASSPPDCINRYTRPGKSPGSYARRFAPQGVGFRASRTRCRKAALNEQGTRGVQRKALNRPQLEHFGLEGWFRTSSPRRLPRRASLSGVSVPEVRFEPFAYVPALGRKGNACGRCGLPSLHATRLRADPKSPE